MNIQLQFGGICILLLLFYFYKRQGNLGLYISKIFMIALDVCFVCLVLDIISIVLIVNQDLFPMWLVKAECKTYLVFLVFTGYIALFYANADVNSLAKSDRYSRRITVLAVVFAVLIYALPIETFYDGNYTVYTYGPACYATYVGALLFVFATLFKLSMQGKIMNPKRRSAMAIWMAIWIAAALVQFLNSNLLLVGFASSLGILILFFELENPEIFIDRDSGFYNYYALEEFTRQKYRLREDCCGMLVMLDYDNEKNESLENTGAAMDEVMQFFRELHNVTLFKMDSREIGMIFSDPEELEKKHAILRDRFQRGWGEGNEKPLFMNAQFVVVPSLMIAKDASEMMGLLKYFCAHFSDIALSDTLMLDENSITQKKEREEMAEIIRHAITEDRVEVFFQPIYSTATKTFVSAEALARIRQADGSILPPGLFIPIAEETGLITHIGEIVFEKTCRFIKQHNIQQYGVNYIEVNLSVVQCGKKTLAEDYISIMDKYGVSPDSINLEITESAAISEKDVFLANMKALIDHGVSFSLDDFGNGQSNLNYIVDMPVRIVKFDRDMTQAYFKTVRASFVVQAVTEMMHKMRLKVVAEGVETEDQLTVMEALGIDYIQGYYFSKPVAEDVFLDFVKEKNKTA